MLPTNKLVRNILRRCSRTAYDNLVRESKLSPIEKQCVNLFILDNKTQLEIAAQINLSERSVRLSLSHAYGKILGCRLFADMLSDTSDNACYARAIGGDINVWNDTTISATADTGTDPPAAVYGTVVIGK